MLQVTLYLRLESRLIFLRHIGTLISTKAILSLFEKGRAMPGFFCL